MSRPRSALPAAAVAGVLLLVIIGGCDTASRPSPTVGASTRTTTSTTTSTTTTGLTTVVPPVLSASPPSHSVPASAPTAAAVAAVRDRFAALERGDRAGWLSGLERGALPGSGADAATQSRIFERMRAMGVVDLHVTSGEQGTGGSVSLVRVTATYRLKGFDTALRAVAVAVEVGVGPVSDGSAPLTSWHPADRPQPWDLEGLRVGRTDDALVLVVGTPARLAELQRRARVASARVAAVWGRSRPAVWVAPASDADAGRLLGRPPASVEGLAAVTDGPLETGLPAGADRIVVLPSAWDALTGAGRDVVLTHELTHVTIRASTTRAVPDWLSEGFAELVAYRSVPLAEGVVVAPALARARREGPATSLPTDADFTPGTGRVEAAYGLSLLAARTIADDHGLAALVHFYREAAGALPVPTSTVGDAEAVTDLALRHALDTDRATLVARWRGRVERILR